MIPLEPIELSDHLPLWLHVETDIEGSAWTKF
jgi:hypothetical protein